MTVTTNEKHGDEHRIIIEVNGIELDILSNKDGIVASLTSGEELSHDWE
jgi:hypothetical protein